jgi:type II secretory pathway predicted ATPase ExeA
MYEHFFGLRERPFDLTPNPRFLVLTPHHREALSNLHYGIVGRKGITLLTGEAGTGKTTLVRTALDAQRQPESLCVHLNNPTLSRQEFIECLAYGFGLSQEARASKAVFLRELEQRLLERATLSAPTLLVIDEAQSLPFELLEEVRLLANIETDDEKLLPVLLVGQPELAQRLNDPSLRQLKQRVALRCELRPLTLAETTIYIAARARSAGADHPLFTREAVALIHHHSGGVPRTISVISDNALVSAFALGRPLVGRDVVADVCRDFDLTAPAPVPAASAPEVKPQEAPAGHGAVLRISGRAPVGAPPARQDDGHVTAAASPCGWRLSFF